MGFTRLVSFFTVILVFACDQASKQWVLLWFQKGGEPFSLTSFLNIILSGNQGISFGLLKADSSLGVVLLIVVAAFLSLYLLKCLWQSRHGWSSFFYSLVLGGAMGNITDRILYKKVIDFIDFHVAGYHWYTFNMADCGVVIGVCGLLICAWHGERSIANSL